MSKNNTTGATPKLSIIVPVFRVEKFLARCVDSILTQTYRNIEVILVDDGSPDNCPRICDDYSRVDTRVRVIHKLNGGLCSARNAGLDVANGDYITFVDSDDWIEPDAYLGLMSKCIEYQADIAGGGYRYVRPWKTDNKILEVQFDKSCRLLNSEDALHELYFGGQMFMPMSIMVWNKVYKRSLFDNLRFAEGYIHEDVQITPMLLNRANRIVAFNHLVYNYNIHLGEASTSGMKANVLKTDSYVVMTRSVYEYFKESKYDRISTHVAGQYFNALLNAYYISSCNYKSSAEWRNKMLEYKTAILRQKNIIKAVYPATPYRVYFISPLLFRILKKSTIGFKQLKYKIHRSITGKN